MHEDDGQPGVARADLLDVQQHAVVGLDERAAVGLPRGGAERVVLAQVSGHQLGGQLPGLTQLRGTHPAGRDPADGHAGRRAGRGQADDRADDAGGAPVGGGLLRALAAGHQTAPAEPT